MSNTTATSAQRPVTVLDAEPKTKPATNNRKRFFLLVGSALFAAVVVYLYQEGWIAIPVLNWDRVFGYTIPWIALAFLAVVGIATIERGWIGGMLLALAVLGFIWNWHAADYVPERSQIRMVKRNANSFMQDRASEIEEDNFEADNHTGSGGYRRANGHHDPNAWFMTAMSAADETRDDGRRYRAVNARAEDRDERIPQANVMAGDYWTTLAEIRVPTLITVAQGDVITPRFRPNESTNADGVPFDFSRHQYDQTVLMKERADHHLPMTDTGNVGELIGRFYENGSSPRLGFPMGTSSVLCVGPGFHSGGNFQAMQNGLAVVDQLPMTLDIGNTTGKFKLQIVPDDPPHGQMFATNICQQHPGVLVVKKPTLQAPTTLMAQK